MEHTIGNEALNIALYMKASLKIIAATLLILALYFWYKRFDVFMHPEFYGELMVPIILTVLGVYLFLYKSKPKEK